jgi:hypothetical protein
VAQGPRRQRPERDPVSVEIRLEMPPPRPGPWVPRSKKSWPTSSRRRPISSRTTAAKDQVQSCSTWRTHHRFRPSPSPSFILALGLAALRSEEWLPGIPEGLAPAGHGERHSCRPHREDSGFHELGRPEGRQPTRGHRPRQGACRIAPLRAWPCYIISPHACTNRSKSKPTGRVANE